MRSHTFQIHKTFGEEWSKKLQSLIHGKQYKRTCHFVDDEYRTKVVFPNYEDIYKVFSLTSFSTIKVVILGQDPYHKKGQAHGLAFSVKGSTTLPPSLKNIYKEIESDLTVKKDFSSGNLEQWAQQGVFLLNTILTVEDGSPLSHKGKGWEYFTDAVIKTISDDSEHVVFMLWGKYAQQKEVLIDTKKHLVLTAPHPSPFSARTGFFGSKHFSRCNLYLKRHHKKPIMW